MKKILCSSVSICASLMLFSQPDNDTSKTHKIEPQPATIKAEDGSVIKGRLHQAAEDTVYLIALEPLPKPAVGIYSTNLYTNKISSAVPQMGIISFHKKNRVGRGALIGFGTGAALGAIIGFASGNDEPGYFSLTAAEKALVGSVGLGVTGALVGTIIGLFSKTSFAIGGERQKYKEKQHQLAINALAR